jgi:ubiquinone/menaquinone biosynthesis C-methylase UbiE
MRRRRGKELPLNKPSVSEIRDWWASHPMTYGNTHGGAQFRTPDKKQVTLTLGTREFFDAADQRFYAWNPTLHTLEDKFGVLFDYKRFKGKQVLELGCGLGCMAMNWAQKGAHITATDLNPMAISQTRRRFDLFGLEGSILEMDAENLCYPDQTFDFAYSWGVLHHTLNIKQALAELYRVLKPGGSTGVMLYNRNSLLYLYTIRILEGYLHLENDFLTPLKLASRYTDGSREEGNPYTWPVTKKEIVENLFSQFRDVRIDVLGSDIAHVLDLAFPRFGTYLFPRIGLRALGRRWGWSLWITGRKV